jgi:DNA-binding XRE family transcriptional regulator
MFLVDSCDDISRHLTPLPEGALVFQHSREVADTVVSQLAKAFDPEASKKIEFVKIVHDTSSLIVRMFSGKHYLLHVGEFDETDDSSIERVEISEDHFYCKVVQSSGNWFEVPWDDVFYHCEPEYEYYKGRNDQESDHDRVERIGVKIKELRVSKGLSISKLAEITGIQRPNLSRLEHGKHLPSLETLERIADGLNVAVVELVAK